MLIFREFLIYHFNNIIETIKTFPTPLLADGED